MSHPASTASRTLKIGVVTAIPTPYRDPFWNVVAALEGIELELIYCARSKDDRPWDISWEQNYRSHYPKTINLAAKFGAAASIYWNSEIRNILAASNFDGLIIGGYNHPTMLWAIHYARRHRIPYFLASESYLQQSRARWKHIVKNGLVRRVVRHAKGCLPTGSLAAEYLVHYGAPKENLCLVPNIPDVAQFHRDALGLVSMRSQIRRDLGLKKPTILFVGRFIEMKGGHYLIEAFERLRCDTDAELVMLGDGPLRPDWESLARDLGVSEWVRFEGFQAPESLPQWFAASDLMCLPSTNETWSVVVLEALSSGLPVVVTDRVGCYPNAVTDSTVGTVVSAGSVDALGAGLRSQLQNQVTHSQVFEAWSDTRQSFTYERVGARLAEFLQSNC